MVALFAVDVWSRYVAVARNAQTVGHVLVKFISGVKDGTVELAFDNEPALVAGVAFCKAAARSKTGLSTIVSPNKSYDKGRASIAERFVQTVRGIQKPLLNHTEAEIEASTHGVLWTSPSQSTPKNCGTPTTQCRGDRRGNLLSEGYSASEPFDDSDA